jgi:hypothetical protein
MTSSLKKIRLKAKYLLCNLKNFWCVPLSVDVRNFNFDLLAQMQA